MEYRLPRSLYKTTTVKLYDIEYLIYNQSKLENTLFGFNIPLFQRGLVWTKSQKIKLIESIFLEIPIGTYMVNDIFNTHDFEDDLNNLLLDGQQRLNAIFSYINDGFKVFGFYYSELNKKERNVFVRSPFHCIVVHEINSEKLKNIYNLLNFGGTEHEK